MLEADQSRDDLSLSSDSLLELLQLIQRKCGSFRFKAHGFSMSPTIRDGDTVILSPHPGAEYRRGDIAAFQPCGTRRVVIHRILRRQGDAYFFKGDSSFQSDGWIPASRLLALVTGIERRKSDVSSSRRIDPRTPAVFYLAIYPARSLIRGWLARGWHLFAKGRKILR